MIKSVALGVGVAPVRMGRSHGLAWGGGGVREGVGARVSAVSVARAERLVNLVLCLLSTRQYLSAERIRSIVPGYGDAPTEEAFFRMFERDKTELRELGVPLEVGRDVSQETPDGYRIARRDYELGDIDLEPDEAAAVALAVRLWDSPELTGAAQGALIKLRAAGVDVDESPAVVEPKVRTTESAFTPLLSAVQDGRAVSFAYRRPSPAELMKRTVEPWGVVSWRGRWYLVGHDRDRNAPRCFRLSRIVGDVTTFGPANGFTRPEKINLLDFVARTGSEPSSTSYAKVWVVRGKRPACGAAPSTWAPVRSPGSSVTSWNWSCTTRSPPRAGWPGSGRMSLCWNRKCCASPSTNDWWRTRDHQYPRPAAAAARARAVPARPPGHPGRRGRRRLRCQ
ncbi:hypothetical protein GCM10029964_045580 [Kibdelosporangium lantanae]